MKVNWKQIGRVTLSIVGALVPAVDRAEKAIAGIAKAKTGPDKQAAALEMVKASVALAEESLDKDLLNDPEVEAATKSLIDAVVALQNVVARKAA